MGSTAGVNNFLGSGAISIGEAQYYDIYGKIVVKDGDDEKTLDLTEYLEEFFIHSNFDNGDCPIVTMKLKSLIQIYKSIMDDYQNIVFEINIDRTVKPGADSEKIANPVSIYKEKKFLMMEPKNYTQYNEDATMRDLTDEDKLQGAWISYTIVLVEENCLSCRKTFENLVMSEATVSDALKYLIGKNVSNKNLIIKKPDNETSYEEIFIPPMNFYDSIKYLQYHYGIYKQGFITFNDLDNFYLCGKNNTIFTKKNDVKVENIEIFFTNANASRADIDGEPTSRISDDKQTLFVSTKMTPKFLMQDTLLRQVYGKDVSIGRDHTQPEERLISTVLDGGIESKDSRENYLWCKSASQYVGEELTLLLNEKAEQAKVSIFNTYFDCFNPSVTVSLSFSSDTNKAYEGKFRISKADHRFTKIENPRSLGLNKGYKTLFVNSTILDLVRK